MIKFKKFLAAAMTGVMMFGMVATAAPAISAYAEGEAAAKSKYSVEVDYVNFTATIKDTTASATAASDVYVVLEVLKDKEGTKVSSTHVYPVEEVTVPEGESETKFFGAVIDLSFLKASKEAYIRVHGDSEKDSSDIVTVSPQAKKVAIKYTSGQETLLKALSIDKAAPTEEVLAAYEYRTLYGSNYSDLKDLDKDMVEVAGTTLVVRSKAVPSGEKAAPAGVEVKVKIPAAPKAPKVTIDYAKGIFKLPKNAEATVDSQIIFNEPDTTARAAGDLTSTPWKDLSITTGDQALILGLFDETKTEAMVEALTTNGFTLVVRTKAGKKAASNPAIVLVEGVDTPVQTPGTEEGSVLDEVKIGDAKLTWKVSATDITYTASGADFEYYDAAKSKWVAIKSTKPVVVKTATSADVKVKVRQAGVKATKTTDGKLPSAALEVTVKAYVAPTPEATPTPETSPSA